MLEDDTKSLFSPDVFYTMKSSRQIIVEPLMETHVNGHANGHSTGNGHAAGNGSRTPRKGLANGFHNEAVQIEIPAPPSSLFPTEWGKTGMAFLYALCCFVLTTVFISIVHERVPPKEVSPPLPDKFFDIFDRVQWAFTVCEINGMILLFLWIVQWSLLKHK